MNVAGKYMNTMPGVRFFKGWELQLVNLSLIIDLEQSWPAMSAFCSDFFLFRIKLRPLLTVLQGP